ncbi:MAG: hypothetical protein ACK5TC_02980, partial [bacterium]
MAEEPSKQNARDAEFLADGPVVFRYRLFSKRTMGIPQSPVKNQSSRHNLDAVHFESQNAGMHRVD